MDDVEVLAGETRRFWRLGDGPIGNVAWLLENSGAIVSRGALGAETLDAFSAWVEAEGTPYVILGAEKESAVRSRLDAAHELAHLLLHRQTERTAFNKPAVFQEIEARAFRFASAFLLPAESFAKDLSEPSLDLMRILKQKYLVSIGAMIRRAEHLGLIAGEQAKQLWRSRSYRGWSKDEPLDDELPVEQPRVLRRAVEMLLAERVVTKEEIRSDLPFALADITELVGLPPEALADAPPNLRILDPSQRRRRTPPDRRGMRGQVADFPART